MSLKSQINTQQAEKLISEGWEFKCCRHSFYHFNTWVGKNGRAKYFNSIVRRTLLNKGYICKDITLNSKGEGKWKKAIE
jgi:hypothetical protein